jgi:hypothetical protein
MENRERNNIYAVPFIGGILCIITLFNPDLIFFISYNLITGMVFFIPTLLEVICGIIMLYSAIKMRSGKTTWIEERKKLMISSWLAFSISLSFAIFLKLLGLGAYFVIVLEYGLVGGLITILGIYFYKFITERNFIAGPTLVQERKKSEPSPMKEQVFYANPKFCTDCGFNLEGGPFKFCPNCGNQINSE